jgi:hypothetical protein
LESPQSISTGDTYPLNADIASLEQREAIHFLLQTLPKQVKGLLNDFCTSLSLRLLPTEQETLKQVLKYCLMLKSPFEALRLEAGRWFTTNREEVAQIQSFNAFWDYFGELVF